MKKLVLSAAAAVTLCVAGGAWADAECQAGSAWGVKEGCGGPNYGPDTAAGVLGNSGVTIVPATPYYGYPAAAGPAYPYFRNDAERRDWERRRPQAQGRHGGDRDRDGVPNNMDRHPRDPSRW